MAFENLNDERPFEERLWASGFSLVAGTDEAGRGALAGPLVAASVILRSGTRIDGLDDSKLLSPKKRDTLYDEITEVALDWRVAVIEHSEIDTNGLQWANLAALERSVEGLSTRPDFVLSDAFSLPNLDLPRLAIIKGDKLSKVIAAASVIAKVTRDRMMVEYHQIFPEYRFDEHKGYSTPLHKSLIKEHGPCPIHRRSFSPVEEAYRLQLEGV